MKRKWILAAAATLFLAVALSATWTATNAKDKDDSRNSPQDIKKCDDELTQCKADCDKSVIDVEGNLQACKKKCDNDRAACLPYRRHPNLGTRPDAVKPAPPTTH